jgi:hypothetical protein
VDVSGDSATTGDVSHLFYSSVSSQHAAFPKILWHVEPLLGGDCEIANCTVATARQQPTNNRGMVFSAWSAKQQLNSNRGTVFSVWTMLRY